MLTGMTARRLLSMVSLFGSVYLGSLGCGGGPSQCYLVNGNEAKKLLTPGTMLLDARPREPAPMVKLPGAVAIPRNEFSYRLKNLDARTRIVVFAESRGAAHDAADELREAGFVVYELGSVEDWHSQNSKCEE
jgi:rhodanese-related sulfurtransferase